MLTRSSVCVLALQGTEHRERCPCLHRRLTALTLSMSSSSCFRVFSWLNVLIFCWSSTVTSTGPRLPACARRQGLTVSAGDLLSTAAHQIGRPDVPARQCNSRAQWSYLAGHAYSMGFAQARSIDMFAMQRDGYCGGKGREK